MLQPEQLDRFVGVAAQPGVGRGEQPSWQRPPELLLGY